METQAIDRWAIIQARDARYDGQFVFGVRSTGIYCKPSCPARHPAPERVAYFAAPEEARAAGYRACRRCHPDVAVAPLAQGELVAAICRALEADGPAPTLVELGTQFAMSPTHLQRIFARAVGVSPRQYAAQQRRNRVRAQLRGGEEVTTAIYNAGYGASSSFYTQDSAGLGMAPAHYRRGGPAVAVRYAVAPCPLGQVLIAATARGACFVALGDDREELVRQLQAEYPAAICQADDQDLEIHLRAILAYLQGSLPHPDLPLDVRATGFQEQVWRTLRTIPPGTTVTYAELARAIGQPTATRAVAHACATNAVSLVIPCHRVVHADGSRSGYRWGPERKVALQAIERGTRG